MSKHRAKCEEEDYNLAMAEAVRWGLLAFAFLFAAFILAIVMAAREAVTPVPVVSMVASVFIAYYCRRQSGYHHRRARLIQYEAMKTSEEAA